MITLDAKVDQRALKAYDKRLEKVMGKPLRNRAQNLIGVTVKRRVVPGLKAVAPTGPKRQRRSSGAIKIVGQKRRKTLRGSAKAKLLKKRGGEDIRPTWAGYTAFHALMYMSETKSHSLATRRLYGPMQIGKAFGRWTQPGSSNFGTSNYRSGYAHFPDGEVRPLAGITVSGTSAHDLVGKAWDSVKGGVLRDISRDIFDTR